eukprot:CAMPEP_0119259732 /NCGR_PEP_ID=MMETSP1329-20130426/432_1 /TAXON_ID=114041 /ORGANISM="Genus nov. species nov., Strain RCC1024" /LENGTH=137 /DNA_ID=CAMNT_0007259131 /DNA_START=72 /DNA_END=485 /DNA_ORIENTATION=-
MSLPAYDVVCQPCTAAMGPPDKEFGGAKMWVKNDLPDGRQVQRLFIPKGFDWRKTISPLLTKPGGEPVQWCPVTHFGYLESGSMCIKFKDSDELKVIKAGETYLVPPGHIPIMNEDAVMVEFTQDNTYTKPEFAEKK